MKDKLIGKKLEEGFSTIEMLIAFVILIVTLVSVVQVTFGNQSVAVDSQTSDEAIFLAQKYLEDARASRSHDDFLSIVSVSSTPIPNNIFTRQTKVLDISPCAKQVTSLITWQQSLRTLSTSMTTLLTDPTEAIALGSDCASSPPTGGWNPPELFASDTISPGKFDTVDVLQKIAYLGSDVLPHLYIADARNAYLGQNKTDPMMVSFANNFNFDGNTIDEINDIDTYKDLSTGKVYAFTATASATAQFNVIDVTDIHNPVLVAKRKLAGITATDSTAWGWRTYYYNKRLYITSRETAGPELHIFDVSDPANPTEIGSKELNTTVNDFTVREDIAYFANQSDLRELLVYDVSDPSLVLEIVGARIDLPGNQNGESVFLLGNKLYFGRQETSSGPEFYILDASDPRSAIGGLPVVGQYNLNKDVTGIRVNSKFAFIASRDDSSGGFKVLDISNPLNIQPIYLTFNFGNKLRDMDYGDDFVYAVGNSTPNFQILYSP
jgi:Tfp pilus assembly protein PilV